MKIIFLHSIFLCIFSFSSIAQSATELNILASKKYESEDYKGAIQDFTKLIMLQPNDAVVYNNRGTAKMDMGDYRGAIDDFNKALKLNVKYNKAYCNRGTAYMEMKNYPLALKDLNKAILLDSKYGKAYNNRGLVKNFMGDKHGGCLDFSKAGELGNDRAYENIRRFCD